MTSRERMVTVLRHGVPDRVPIGYSANPGIDWRLKAHFGLDTDDHEGLRRRLGADCRGVGAPYVGPRLHAASEDPDVRVNPAWGIRDRRIAHGSGEYWEPYGEPLRDLDEAAAAAWPMPDPEDYDYSAVADQCAAAGDHAVFAHAGFEVMNWTGRLTGHETMYVGLATDDPALATLIKRFTGIRYEILRRTLEAAGGRVDFVWIGEDLGTQRGPRIGLDLFRRRIRPVHQRFIDLARSRDLPVMMHSCGSSSWAFEDLIAMGVDAIDTLQPEAAEMAPAYLKRTYGDRLAFHGCISTAGAVARGTVDETVATCRRTLRVMMPGGGYCFAPTHMLQDDSPTENVVAMYETAHELGRY